MELTETDFFTNCKKALAEAAKNHSTALAYGSAETFADYRHTCGIIKGLDSALTVMEEVLKEMSKESI